MPSSACKKDELVGPIHRPGTDDLEPVLEAQRNDSRAPFVDPCRHLAGLDDVLAQLRRRHASGSAAKGAISSRRRIRSSIGGFISRLFPGGGAANRLPLSFRLVP